jgi:spermidine synthase
MAGRSLTSLAIASVLFFASGALGLGYQLVWIRKAALVVGTSQIALSTVLTSFFLGLALGSLFVGRHLRSRRWSPLFVYGLFEAAIGIFALAFPTLFGLAEAAYAALHPLFQTYAPGLFLLRFSLLFLLFLVPTFFMGGTLPLLLDGLVARDRAIGSLTSFLYGLNILGAVAGVLLTGYFAIPTLGMNGTSFAAGFGNLAIAAVAVLAFGRTPPLHPPAADTRPPPRLPGFFASLSFVSGLAAIGYQVAWARYFNLFSTSSVYLTAVLLGVYLAALATGSLLLAPALARRIHPLRIAAVLQPLVPVVAFASLDLWRLGVLRFETVDGYEVRPSWSFVSETADAIFFSPLLQMALVIFVPVVLLGTGLPSLIAAAARRSDQLRPAAGSLVFWNTLGSSAGGFVSGYVLIPGLGLTGALFTLALLSIAFGAAAAWRAGRETAPDVSLAALRGSATLTLFALAATIFLLREDVTLRTLERYGWGSTASDDELVALVEGPLTTAFVYDSPEHLAIGAGNVCYAVARHHTASPQAIQGHLPALFYPRPGAPKRVLGIALGSGQTFGALLHYPIEHMDVVDISSEVVQLSLRHFAPFNNRLSSDERVSFHMDDGRHFVERAAADSYDVVTLEPPPPTNDGVYSLYSLEFYRATRRVLREGGILAQWLPLNLVTPEDLRGMLKTQSAVFPFTFVLRSGRLDFVILSFDTTEAPRLHTRWIAERAPRFEREQLVRGSHWEETSRHEIASLEGILSLLLTGPGDIERIEVAALHRDDDQRLSYSSGDRELYRRYRGRPLSFLSFAALPLTPFSELQRYFGDPIPVAALDEERARTLTPYGVPSPRVLADAEARFEAASTPVERSARAFEAVALYERGLALEAELAWIERALVAHPTESRPAPLARAAGVVARHAPIQSERIRAWLAALPPQQRLSLVARAMTDALEEWEGRERARRAAYLWQ